MKKIDMFAEMPLSTDEIIKAALSEDIGSGDHTSLATVEGRKQASARLLVKESCVLAGIDLAGKIFHFTDNTLQFRKLMHDGMAANRNDVAFTVSGRATSILSMERTVLNFMQRLSGIATQTRRIVDRISDYNAIVLDTRKTTPLLRELEKYAVRIGGGQNHRMGLYDMIMIKDNHNDFSGGIKTSIENTLAYLAKNRLNLRIEIEVRNFNELSEVLEAGGVHRIMLDNFSPPDLLKAVKMVAGRYETEASGGITENNIEEYAASGVDFISIGALTHHIKSIDMSLKAIPS